MVAFTLLRHLSCHEAENLQKLFDFIVFESRLALRIKHWGASTGVTYKLRDKNAIVLRRWNITTQERKLCDVEIENYYITLYTEQQKKRPAYIFLYYLKIKHQKIYFLIKYEHCNV